MIGCIIQARMGSTRLPGKAMKKIHGKIPMLKFQLNQLNNSKRIDKIVIATTSLSNDDLIVEFCNENKLEYFRGQSKDVLDRYYKCAKKFHFPIIVRITSDNPLIDPKIVDNVIEKFLDTKCDYMSTEYPKTFPLGFAVEVFSFEALEKSWNEARLPSEREHVTPYMIKSKTLFKHSNYSHSENLSHIRCTVDTDFDFRLIEQIISKINLRPIYLSHILELYGKEQSIFEINSHVKHDGYERSLKEDEEYLKKVENEYEKTN